MDMNQYNMGGGLPYGGFPVGLGPLPLGFEDDIVMQGYEGLTEADKERLILQCKDAKTAKDKEKIVDSVSSDIDARGLLEEEASVSTSRRPW